MSDLSQAKTPLLRFVMDLLSCTTNPQQIKVIKFEAKAWYTLPVFTLPVSKMIFDTRVYGRAVNTARKHGCHFGHAFYGPC